MKTKEALENEHLSTLYAKHKADIESAFGNLKVTLTRFLPRGLLKTQTEFWVDSMAHNLRKLAGKRLANSSNTAKVLATFFA
ncbi:transposase [Savagea faecisuis]|uniref:Transposase n=1 Tax=Savagea faecisuis TaxID=1274803 RepID=A0ABW3GX44_9BACL